MRRLDWEDVMVWAIGLIILAAIVYLGVGWLLHVEPPPYCPDHYSTC